MAGLVVFIKRHKVYLYTMPARLRIFFFCTLLALLVPGMLRAQDKSGLVRVSGTVVSKDNLPLLAVVIANKRTSLGIGADITGAFTLQALRTDTLLVSAHGHQMVKICFRDSAVKSDYRVRIVLSQLSVQLDPVNVEGEKSLLQVKKDIKQLEKKDVKKIDNGVQAFYSPITALYERFSRLERSKQWVAEQEYQERKNEALKNLFRIYIKYDIIELTEVQFDAFIRYCELSDDFIKTASDFELVAYIQDRYENFTKLAKNAGGLSFERTEPEVYEMIIPNYDSLANGDNAFNDYYYKTENKPDGKLIIRNEHGNIVRECYYKDEKMGEDRWWYSSGEKEWYGDWGYENKLRVFTRWYKSGQKKSEQDSTGAVYHWHENGQKSKEVLYRNDKREKTVRRWNEKGILLLEEFYRDGKPAGVWKYYNEDGSLREKKSH